MECLDLEEFLTENGIPLNDGNKGRPSTKEEVHNKTSTDQSSFNANNQSDDDSQPGTSNSPTQSERYDELTNFNFNEKKKRLFIICFIIFILSA